MGIDGNRTRPEGAAELLVTVAELVTWVLLRAWKGFNPGQDLIGRLVEAVARFIIHPVLGRAAAALA
jgi:hypothetical protein